MNTQLAQQTQGGDLKSLLNSENMKSQLALALPKHLSADRFCRVATTALTRTPKLATCSQASFFKCLLELSSLGLEPDGRRAHLIPFGKECTLIVDYKGIVELVRRSGEVSYIHADIVCENDEFEYGFGSGAKLEHKPAISNRGEVIAAYSFVKLKDGSEEFDVMSRDEVEAVRKRSRSGNNGPWKTDWNEMAKKTVFRRHSKWLPFSSETAEKIATADDVEFAQPKRKHVVVEMEPLQEVEVESENLQLDDLPPAKEVQEPAKEETKEEQGMAKKDMLVDIIARLGDENIKLDVFTELLVIKELIPKGKKLSTQPYDVVSEVYNKMEDLLQEVPV